MKSSNPRWALMALRRSFVWKGRARRAEAWWFIMVWLLFSTAMAMLSLLPTERVEPGESSSNWPFLPLLLIILALLPGLSCAIRRLHDLDRSGWWYLLVFATVPLAVPVTLEMWDALSGWTLFAFVVIVMFSGALVLLYWFLQRGTIGENRYGPDPLMVD